MNKYQPPLYKSTSFNCPHCMAFAQQIWSTRSNAEYTYTAPNNAIESNWFPLSDYIFSKCNFCLEIAVWRAEKLIYPFVYQIANPNEDLSEDIKSDYLEARNIVNFSARGAAAILRLALQKLLILIGQTGKNLNEDIKVLVTKGLPELIQQSLDFVRVTGNHAVHPGELDVKDNPEIANALFEIINIIAEHFLSQPKRVESLYNLLPEKDKENIKKRDA